MCERGIQAAVEAFMLLHEARDDGRISRSDFQTAMVDLSDLTAAIIADQPDPHAAFGDFLTEMRRAALAYISPGGHA